MKKLFVLAMMLVAVIAKAQTAEDVINKYIAAAGGKEKLQSVKSLQYVQSAAFNTLIGPVDIKMDWIRVENKLFRVNTTSELFGTGFSLVTDTSGWVLIPANPFAENSQEKLQKLKPEERQGLATQMACDGFFPELVDYSKKGYTAEYAGEAKVSGRAVYKIKLKKDKDDRIYMIDKQTGFVNAMTVKGAAAMAMSGMGNTGMGGRSDKAEFTFNYSNYQDAGGIKVPGKVKLDLPMGTIESSITSVRVNQAVDAKWYKPQ